MVNALIQSTQYDIVMSWEDESMGKKYKRMKYEFTLDTVDIPIVSNTNVQSVLTMRAIYRKLNQIGADSEYSRHIPLTTLLENAWNISTRLSRYLSAAYKITSEVGARMNPTTSRLQFYDDLKNPADPNFDLLPDVFTGDQSIARPLLTRACTGWEEIHTVSIKLVNREKIIAPVPGPLLYEKKWNEEISMYN